MILVDTSVLVDFLPGRGTQATGYLGDFETIASVRPLATLP